MDRKSKNHKDRPSTTTKCMLTVLIMTNNTEPVAFDGLLIGNRRWKRKIVPLEPQENPTRMH
jgi:hypothetical protein